MAVERTNLTGSRPPEIHAIATLNPDGESRMRNVFELEGLLAESDVLGATTTLSCEGLTLRIDFPEASDSFSFVYASSASGDPRDYAPVTALLQRDQMANIRLVRVVANFDVSFSVNDYPDWTFSPAVGL